jgi:hypothetical protein
MKIGIEEIHTFIWVGTMFIRRILARVGVGKVVYLD